MDFKAGYSPLFHSTIFGTRDGKTFRQCEIPMKIGAYRQRCWNSNEFDIHCNGKPEKLNMIHRDGDKSPVCVCGEHWGGESAWESVWNFELFQTRCLKTNFGASVNDMPNLPT
ncbi:hypothetical protein AVEN_69231-1 [Araneus ventricosus]|uniref:Uncharacterized protein n=1 Tax=Araneus ventricosus TaxID=182803 RepID=A0A4Y2EP42_ARAVE|nr:hypothetical protein AVEN_69231-1 [Araneus ventricosus]